MTQQRSHSPGLHVDPAGIDILVGTAKWRRDAKDGRYGLYRRQGIKGEWKQCAEIGERSVGALCVVPGETPTILAGTSSGIMRSRDGGATWSDNGKSIGDRKVWSLMAHPSHAARVYAGTGPCQIFISEDAGENWTEANIRRSGEIFTLADDGTPLAFAARVTGFAAQPHDGSLFASLEVEGILRSNDGGLNWQDTSDHLLSLATSDHLQEKIGTMDGRKCMADGHAVAVLSSAPFSLFYANRLGLFRSEDRGESWTDVRLDRFSPQTYVRDLVASRLNPERLFACLSVKASGDDGGIWRSDDGGETWRRIDPSLDPGSTMMAISTHPANDDVIVVASYSGKVFVTPDGGKNWHSIPLPADAGEAFTILCTGSL